jgi:hypothetical protein
MKYFNSDLLGFWGALLGALISGIFAITVFALGKRSENKKEKKELLSFGELYCTSVNVLQESYVFGQIAFMDGFIEEIKEKEYNPHRLKTIDASDYLDRISQINIQDLSKLYVLLNRETKNLVIAVNNLDFIKNQLQNYVSDANNSLTESIIDYKQILAIYYGVWSSNTNLPHHSTIQDVIEVEKILTESDIDKEVLAKISTFRQKIENRNKALLSTYSGVRENLISTNKDLSVEINTLKKLIDRKK